MGRRTRLAIGLMGAATFICAVSAFSETTYRFERLWPMLAQPWYFSSPAGLACDDSGNVYVADSFNKRVQKFTAQGQFISMWNGSDGFHPEFDTPQDVALDIDGNVYVVDSAAGRVRVFAPTGEELTAWGEPGAGDGQFDHPMGLALDGVGRVYVADTGNYRIQVFEADGTFVSAWDGLGLNQPGDLAFDSLGEAHIVDTGNARIVRVNATGAYQDAWGETGDVEGAFSHPARLLVDGEDRVYVSDMENFRIQRFSREGAFQLAWGGQGHGTGLFARPDGLALDSFGRILTTDSAWHDRIQVFTQDGVFVSSWGSQRGGPNEYDGPTDIAVDEAGNIYVTDFGNSRIQKLNPEGRFLEYWGPEPGEEGHCTQPYSIAVSTFRQLAYAYDLYHNKIRKYALEDGEFIQEWDSGAGIESMAVFAGLAVTDDHVYLADSLNSKIRKFNHTGSVAGEWGEAGSDAGQLSMPYDVAVSSAGEVYVADTGNNRIQVFDQDGTFLRTWGGSGNGPGQFNTPVALAFTAGGSILVTDSDNHRVQQFSATGVLEAVFGSFGAAPGQLNAPGGLAAMGADRVLVADYMNNRLQQFRAVTQAERAKAIIVAGGGPITGNSLWDATRLCANFAYRALLFSGYTRDDIYYLSADSGVDLDGDGELNDVDSDTTLAALESALAAWAVEGGVDMLTVYLVDHGGENTFRMSATEILGADAFHGWLNTARQSVTGTLLVINDSCHSGSFIRADEKADGMSGMVMITSASPGESAYFMGTGTASFSSLFWMDILNGLDVGSACQFASETVQVLYDGQHPLLEGNGNGVSNETEDLDAASGLYLGIAGAGGAERPKIGEVVAPEQLLGTNKATITAFDISNVNTDAIAETWVVVRPPGALLPEPGSPVLWLPTIPLNPVPDAAGTYQGEYDGFNNAGDYQLAVYARDTAGRTSEPVLKTVNVASPLRRRALLVVGGTIDDPFWPAISNNALTAWQALRFQGYTNDDIRFYSTEAIVAEVNGLPTVDNVRLAITEWAAADTQDLAIYLTGTGGQDYLQMAPGETLVSLSLQAWLNTLQATMPGRVSVICDFCSSGSFLPSLSGVTDGSRIVISGTGRDSAPSFSSNGEVSFSRFFWRQVLSGATLRGAFLTAANALRFADGQNAPCLDDTGDGLYTPGIDGRFAASTLLGRGVRIAADPPIILEVSPAQVLGEGKTEEDNSATIWANPITSTAPIDKVLAVVFPPGFDPRDCGASNPGGELLPMIQEGSGPFTVTYDGFVERGVYQVLVYAEDEAGEVSAPVRTSVEQQSQVVTPDAYEPDDTPESASWIGIGGPVQHHNFSRNADEDWALLFAVEDDLILADTRHLGPSAATRIELYRVDDGVELVASAEYNHPDEENAARLEWIADAEGFYLVRVTNLPAEIYGADTFYELTVRSDMGMSIPGAIAVRVEDEEAGSLGGVKLSLSGFGGLSAVTDSQGETLFPTLPADRWYTLVAEKEGYQSATDSVFVNSAQTASASFTLRGLAVPEGEGEGEPMIEGEGEVAAEGEGEAAAEGEGEVHVEGEGESMAEGEGEGEGEGEDGGCTCLRGEKGAFDIRRMLGDLSILGLSMLMLLSYVGLTRRP